jgi:hypothetical protein
MQWLLQNIRVRVGFALKNPRYALSTLYGELTFSDERFLAGMCGVLLAPFGDSWMNPAILLNLLRILPTSLKSSAHFPAFSADLYAKKVSNRYAAIRAQKMKVLAGSRVAPFAMDYSISETPANFYHPYLHSRQPSHL